MLRRFALAAFVMAALLGTQGVVARTSEGIEWHATLQSVPSVACVKSAIANTQGLSLAGYKHDEQPRMFAGTEHWDHYDIVVAALHTPGRPADMGLHIGSSRHGDIRLSLNYGNWPKFEDLTDSLAKALFATLASDCGLADLGARAEKKQVMSWDPNFLPTF